MALKLFPPVETDASLDDIRLLTPTQVADLLGTSTQTVSKWFKSGQFPVVKIGTMTRVSVATLRKWVLAHGGKFG